MSFNKAKKGGRLLGHNGMYMGDIFEFERLQMFFTTNANQKEALFPKSCTEVKTEGDIFQRTVQLEKKNIFLFNVKLVNQRRSVVHLRVNSLCVGLISDLFLQFVSVQLQLLLR